MADGTHVHADGDADALIAAHLDGSLAPADAERLRERLRADTGARRALVASAVQASIFARGALEQPSRAAAPRRPLTRTTPWLAVAAGIAAAAAPIWWFARPAPDRAVSVDGPVTATRGGATIDLASDPWLRAGDHLSVGDAVAHLRWADEATAVTVDPGSELDLLSTHGAKKLLMGHGRLVAAVAPQPATGGFRVATPRGEVSVVGTHFDVRADGHVTTVHVDHGTVEVEPASGAAPARVTAGCDAVCDEAGLRVSDAAKPAPAPSVPDTRRVMSCDAATFKSFPERLGTVANGMVVGIDNPTTPGAVTMIQFGAVHATMATVSDDLELRMAIAVDRPTTVAVVLVYEDGITWMGNIQAERAVQAGAQQVVFQRGDFTLRAGRASTTQFPGRVSVVALMCYGPATGLTMSSLELRSTPR